MSAYTGRTGPNFSQYLNNLNTIQSGYDQELVGADDVNLDQELAMFTNADFTDFDALGGGFPNDSSINFNINDGPQSNVEIGSDIKYEELLSGKDITMNVIGDMTLTMDQANLTILCQLMAHRCSLCRNSRRASRNRRATHLPRTLLPLHRQLRSRRDPRESRMSHRSPWKNNLALPLKKINVAETLPLVLVSESKRSSENKRWNTT